MAASRYSLCKHSLSLIRTNNLMLKKLATWLRRAQTEKSPTERLATEVGPVAAIILLGTSPRAIHEVLMLSNPVARLIVVEDNDELFGHVKGRQPHAEQVSGTSPEFGLTLTGLPERSVLVQGMNSCGSKPRNSAVERHLSNGSTHPLVRFGENQTEVFAPPPGLLWTSKRVRVGHPHEQHWTHVQVWRLNAD